MSRLRTIAAATASGWALSGHVALGATAIGHVSVTILPAPAAVTEAMPMRFDVSGGKQPGGDIVLHSSGRNAAMVTLTGAPNEAITISVASGRAGTGPAAAIALDAVTDNASKSPAMDSAGKLTVAVGATMSMAASQRAGVYAGTYFVTVNY